jgi:hypothetical protein
VTTTAGVVDIVEAILDDRQPARTMSAALGV